MTARSARAETIHCVFSTSPLAQHLVAPPPPSTGWPGRSGSAPGRGRAAPKACRWSTLKSTFAAALAPYCGGDTPGNAKVPTSSAHSRRDEPGSGQGMVGSCGAGFGHSAVRWVGSGVAARTSADRAPTQRCPGQQEFHATFPARWQFIPRAPNGQPRALARKTPPTRVSFPSFGFRQKERDTWI